MFGAEKIARTRFAPPRLGPYVIPRPHLMAHLEQAANCPVTVIKADPGYGKSTLLSQFVGATRRQTFWYSVTEVEADPLLYLLHLIYVFRTVYPTCGDKALSLLETETGSATLWEPAINAFVNDLLESLQTETLLIVDDYHLVDIPQINHVTEYLIERIPPRLHLIFTTRHTPNWQARIRWRAYGELLEITRADLAFSPDEVAVLFRQRTGKTISPREAEALASETEGWIMALQLLGEKMLPQVSGRQSMLQAINQLPGQLDALFDFLTQLVLNQHPPAMYRFMLQTSILAQMDPAICDFIRERSDSQEHLTYLEQHSLFLVRLGPDTWRYHQLFSDFLNRRAELDISERKLLHGKAAAYYLQKERQEEAIFHLLQAGSFAQAVELIAKIAPVMANQGRYGRLAEWIDNIPPDLQQNYPDLLLQRGDIFRFHSQFDSAFSCYEQARSCYQARSDDHSQSRALQGQALIYIDTVRPNLAIPLLKQALKLVDRKAYAERAELLLLLAENKINQGELGPGGRLYRRVYQLCGFEHLPEVDPRLSFRTGRLEETQQILAHMLKHDPLAKGGQRAPRSHREAILISAWVSAYLGNGDLARQQAEQGIQLAEALDSPLVKAVALQRLGHGWLTGPDYNATRAAEAYQAALEVLTSINLPRFYEESLWGLTLIEGLAGRFEQARGYAGQAIAILEEAGDAYWTWMCRLGLGIAAVLTEQADAPDFLGRAIQQGQLIGDRYGLCIAQLWLALHFVRTGQARQALPPLRQALQLAQTYHYQPIFTRITFLGPKDPNWLAILLSLLSPDDPLSVFAATLHAGLKETIQAAVGYGRGLAANMSTPLFVQTLGVFRVWYNGREIPPAAWRRDKALRLFQLLVTYRHNRSLLTREKILGILWGDVPARSAANSLRVALSSLRQSFGVSAASDEELVFIRRERNLLGFDMSAGVLVDADQFTLLIKEARRLRQAEPDRAIELYRQAADLYQGDYLEDCPYSDWAIEERERLLDLHLSATEDLATLLYQRGNFNQAAALCHHILDYDPLWEEAYRLLMSCHWRQGNRSLALRIYQRCVRRLKETLEVEPAPETQQLLQTILKTTPSSVS